MVNLASINEDFSEGPVPMDIADLGNASAQVESEAPAPAPLDAVEGIGETSAPPAPALEAGMGELAESLEADSAPAPSDIHADAGAISEIGEAPAPREDLGGDAGFAGAASSDDVDGPAPRDDLAGVAGLAGAGSFSDVDAPPSPREDLGGDDVSGSLETGGDPVPMSIDALGQLDRG